MNAEELAKAIKKSELDWDEYATKRRIVGKMSEDYPVFLAHALLSGELGVRVIPKEQVGVDKWVAEALVDCTDYGNKCSSCEYGNKCSSCEYEYECGAVKCKAITVLTEALKEVGWKEKK